MIAAGIGSGIVFPLYPVQRCARVAEDILVAGPVSGVVAMRVGVQEYDG